jgi:hypothetical protein
VLLTLAAYGHAHGGASGLLDFLARSFLWHAVSRLVYRLPGGGVLLVAVPCCLWLARRRGWGRAARSRVRARRMT